MLLDWILQVGGVWICTIHDRHRCLKNLAPDYSVIPSGKHVFVCAFLCQIYDSGGLPVMFHKSLCHLHKFRLTVHPSFAISFCVICCNPVIMRPAVNFSSLCVWIHTRAGTGCLDFRRRSHGHDNSSFYKIKMVEVLRVGRCWAVLCLYGVRRPSRGNLPYCYVSLSFVTWSSKQHGGSFVAWKEQTLLLNTHMSPFFLL